VSQNGVLVYRATGLTLGRLVWLDRSGRELQSLSGAGDYRAPALSPDGRRITVRRVDAGNYDVWVIEPERGTTTRFTFDAGSDGNPIWSPDGSQIAWTSDRDPTGIYLKAASGLGADQLLVKTPGVGALVDWSRDGHTLLFQMNNPKTRTDLYLVPVTGDHTPRPLLQTPFAEERGRFSPDGHYVAYESDESGRPEVYVVAIAGAAGKWQVSASGGSEPCWSHDGRELFYLSADQRLMAVPVTPGATFVSSTPRELFRVRVESGTRRNVYCPSPDGSKFLFLLPVGETTTPMTAVLNWRAGLGGK